MFSLEVGGDYGAIVTDSFSSRPKELAYTVRHGASEMAGSAPADGGFRIELPYHPSSRITQDRIGDMTAERSPGLS